MNQPTEPGLYWYETQFLEDKGVARVYRHEHGALWCFFNNMAVNSEQPRSFHEAVGVLKGKWGPRIDIDEWTLEWRFEDE